MSSPLDLNNVQGDILVGLPKKGQTFAFFRINDQKVKDFCKQLMALIPLITTAAQANEDRARIDREKKRAAGLHTPPTLLPMRGINIAFSQKGLKALSINDAIEPGSDKFFTGGMRADAGSLGDTVDSHSQPAQWDAEFKQDIHGVILITGNSHPQIDTALTDVKNILGATIQIVHQIEGHTRPGDISGHEHFGFADGISQPLVDGIPSIPTNGQDVVAQGVILTGRTGDPDAAKRPKWALDGSFLCFRKLQQLVPEFNNFLKQNALPSGGSELLGARLVGRWKSGAPIDLAPFKDDPVLAADPSRNNAFRYDPRSQVRCPFGAHTRKTNPRSDLPPIEGLHPHMILRRGIQFGPEVTTAEANSNASSPDKKLERGLLFVSYQSSVAQGFRFIQKSWANNPGFPFGKGVDGDSESKPPLQGPGDKPPGTGPGFDPIIGVSAPGQIRFVVGTNPDLANAIKPLDLVNKPQPLPLDNVWVVPRGGEYFFSPSISALQETFAQAA